MIDDGLIGDRIRTARKLVGYNQSDVADQLGMSTSTVSDIERGQRAVTGPELYALAELLSQPLDFFVVSPETASPSFRYLFREASEQGLGGRGLEQFEKLCYDYSLLEEITGTPPPPRPPDYSRFGLVSIRDAERLAEMERGRLGLADGPILDMTQLLDGQGGARVFHLPLGDNSLSGAAARDPHGWGCILVNAAEPTYRRTFTIAHEYAHCLVHLGASDGKGTGPPAHIDRGNPEQDFSPRSQSERFCNAFAASFLMPAPRVIDFYERLLGESGSFRDDMLYLVAKYFGVSHIAMGWRLVALRRISREAWRRYLETGPTWSFLARRFDMEQPRHEEPKLRLPPRYVYLAWKAYEDAEISLSRLAELLQESVFELREQLQEHRHTGEDAPGSEHDTRGH